MNSKELRNLHEAYMDVYAPQEIDEGLRSAVKRLLGGKKEAEAPKPESRGAQLRKKYNVGPEKSDTSAKRQILDRSRAKAEKDEKEFGGSKYSKSVAQKSKAAHDSYLKAGYSKYGADDARGSGNMARKRAAALNKEEFEFVVNALIEEGYDLSSYTWDEMYDICLDEAVKGESGERRKDLAAERRSGIKPLSAKEGQKYASYKLSQMSYVKRKRMGEEVEGLEEISKELAHKVVNARIARTGAAFDREMKDRTPENMRDTVDAVDKETRAKRLAAGVRTRRNATNEEVEQIDELSVNKMNDYINKAEKDRDRLNKKWDQGTATSKERKKVFDREEGEARASKKIRQKTGKDSFRLNALDKLKSAITKESYDIFDAILEYLIVEGYADTNESALVIMANMSEEWRESIMEKEDSEYEKASDAALDSRYGYGRATGDKRSFGRAANRSSAAAALRAIRRGERSGSGTSREAGSDAVHKGWAKTAKTSTDQTPEKKERRAGLANTPYSKLPDDEKEKDRVSFDAVRATYNKNKKP